MDNIIGNAITHTTDKSVCNVITSEQIIDAPLTSNGHSHMRYGNGQTTRNSIVSVKSTHTPTIGLKHSHRHNKKKSKKNDINSSNKQKRSKNSKSFQEWENNVDRMANNITR